MENGRETWYGQLLFVAYRVVGVVAGVRYSKTCGAGRQCRGGETMKTSKRGKDGITPLRMAAWQSQADVARLLRDAGAKE